MAALPTTLVEAKQAIDAGELTTRELIDHSLEQIKQTDDTINAWLEVLDDPPAGIPLGVKDVINTTIGHTTAASNMLKDYQAPYNATVINKLTAAGYTALGKLNLDEFAHGASTEYSAFGTTHNPWSPDRVAGGSSGGSAAAVAAGHVLGALGTDTGGSIRHPASFCGVVGLRPTYGRVSRFGVMAYGSSFDQVGPLARTVKDTALLLNSLAGPDPHDATTSTEPVRDYTTVCDTTTNLKGLRIGIPQEFFPDSLNPDIKRTVQAAIGQLQTLGATLVDISLSLTDAAIPVYYLLAKAEASSNLGRYDGLRYPGPTGGGESLLEHYLATRGAGFGPEVKRSILMGTYALSAGYFDAWYKKASQVRTLIRRQYDEAFENVDVIATPTAPEVAFKPDSKDPLAMYLTDAFVTPASCASLPALSVPCGFIDDQEATLPVGLQLIGQPFREDHLFQVGHAYEQSQDWWQQHPQVTEK